MQQSPALTIRGTGCEGTRTKNNGSNRSAGTIRSAFIMCSVSLLHACGGGGGGANASTTEPAGQDASPTDTGAPMIMLVGEALVQITQGQIYEEQGASASDAVDGDVLVTVSGEVDIDTIGTYSRRYTAVDAAGNEASKIRRVAVVAPQSSDPVELIVFADGIVGPTWDLGFGAYDQAIDYATCDGDSGQGCPSMS